MILDTSVIIAYFLQESTFDQVEHLLLGDIPLGIGAPTVVECGIVLNRRIEGDAIRRLTEFLEIMEIRVVPFTERHHIIAIEAYRRFGKGQKHPAKLNYGDCLSYATAKVAGKPLVFVGNDFNKTDLDFIQIQ